ncbi:MAG: uncharacterized membrane protein YbaN (DUF454 family), partial [Halieaceae bacterium]
YSWLLNHPRLGSIVQAWQSGHGLPRKLRNRVLFLLWFSLCSTSLILFKSWVTLGLAVIGIGVTAYMLAQPISDESE